MSARKTRRGYARQRSFDIATTIVGGPRGYAPTRRGRSTPVTETERFDTSPQTIVHNVWPDEAMQGVSTRRGRMTGPQLIATGIGVAVGVFLIGKLMGP